MPDIRYESEVAGAKKVLQDVGDGTHAERTAIVGRVDTSIDDANLATVDVVTDSTPGVWKELMPASTTRRGASVQAMYTSGNAYVRQSDTKPADGKTEGEWKVPSTPALLRFDFAPRRRYFIRGDAPSLLVSVASW